MNWDAVRILRQNVVNITTATREATPDIGNDTEKDIRRVISALCDVIQDNNSLSIDHLNRMVRRRHTDYIKEFSDNYQKYKDTLKITINKLFADNNIPNDVINIIDNAIEILGANLSRDEQDWSLDWLERRNYKNYDPSITVPAYLESRIDIILENVPIQNSGKANFKILKLKQSEEDKIIRDYLFKEYYINEEFDLHEMCLINSPLAYFFIADPDQHVDWGSFTAMFGHQQGFHHGIHGGAVQAEVIAQGYDFSFIGCTKDMRNEIKLTEEWTEMLVQKTGFEKFYSKGTQNWPLMSMHIGRNNNEFSTSYVRKQHTCLDGTVCDYIETPPRFDYVKGELFV